MSRQNTSITAAQALKIPLTGAVPAVAFSACGGSQPYSSPVSASAATTFDCVRSQMVQLGYAIDEADRDRGVVVGSLGLAMQADAEADARTLLISCGGRVDQGEPDRPYGIRPEITTTP